MSTKKLEALKLISAGIQAIIKLEESELSNEVAVTTDTVENAVVNTPPKEDKKDATPDAKAEDKKFSKLAPNPLPVIGVDVPASAIIDNKDSTILSALPEKPPVEEEKKGDDLESMTDAELKALAKDMGIRITLGMRRPRLLEAVRAKIAEENKKKIEEEAAKKEKELPEDSLMKRLREETEEMTDDEIRELLEEAEISAKGGRTALLAKLHEAVKNGVISFDDAEAEDTVNEQDAEDAIVSDVEDPEEMTDSPERIKAMEVFDQQNREAFEHGELDVGAMKDFLKENFNITLSKKATPAEVLDSYITYAMNFIDDDGNTVEEGAYFVRGVPHCCGAPLTISKNKRGETIGKCSICGESYKLEEE